MSLLEAAVSSFANLLVADSGETSASLLHLNWTIASHWILPVLSKLSEISQIS